MFNEYGVQIMTPAYEGDTEQPKIVPEALVRRAGKAAAAEVRRADDPARRTALLRPAAFIARFEAVEGTVWHMRPFISSLMTPIDWR